MLVITSDARPVTAVGVVLPLPAADPSAVTKDGHSRSAARASSSTAKV